MSPEAITPKTEIPTFESGQPVIVERYDRDEHGKRMDTKSPEAGWEVVRTETTGEYAGTVLVRKIEDGVAYEKNLAPDQLSDLQNRYEAIRSGEDVSVVERRQVGHSGLEAAQVTDPSEPAPFSEEWSKRQQERRIEEAMVNPTESNPHMFDEARPAEIKIGRHPVDVVGIYDKNDQTWLIVVDPLEPDNQLRYPADDIVMLRRT